MLGGRVLNLKDIPHGCSTIPAITDGDSSPKTTSSSSEQSNGDESPKKTTTASTLWGSSGFENDITNGTSDLFSQWRKSTTATTGAASLKIEITQDFTTSDTDGSTKPETSTPEEKRYEPWTRVEVMSPRPTRNLTIQRQASFISKPATAATTSKTVPDVASSPIAENSSATTESATSVQQRTSSRLELDSTENHCECACPFL